ncbi:MAG: alpha/beta hydrolase [Leptolyngbyaceae cyanobacterium SM2_5_2]|nr:alpha/beta hydrolase [Leptolyngbyaceae cyanobacterium SM2_5_2]
MNNLKEIAIAVLTLVTSATMPALAAEEVLLKYRGFSRTVPTTDLATLAETGQTSDPVDGLLRQANKEPEELQSLLTRQLAADPVVLDQALNSWPGEWMLDQLGTAIHPVSGEASRQALRSALVLSADNDGQISLLEILQTYPTAEVVLEGDVIASAYDRLATFLGTLSILLP